MKVAVASLSTFLVFVALSGCMDRSDSLPENPSAIEDGPEPLLFEWSPRGETDFAFWLDIVTGPSSECSLEKELKGDGFSTESDLFSYSYIYRFNNTMLQSIWRMSISGGVSSNSVHVGDIHTDMVVHASHDALSMIAINDWWSQGTGTIPPNSTEGSVEAVFGVVNDQDPAVRVECTDRDVLVRLYLADSFRGILSPSSTGGVGFNLDNQLGVLAWNEGDHYSIQTESEVVFLDMISTPYTSTANAAGEFTYQSPSGDESVSFDVEGNEWVIFQRLGTGPGDYGLTYSRWAEDHSSLRGIFAGFSLHQEDGDLVVDDNGTNRSGVDLHFQREQRL